MKVKDYYFEYFYNDYPIWNSIDPGDGGQTLFFNTNTYICNYRLNGNVVSIFKLWVTVIQARVISGHIVYTK